MIKRFCDCCGNELEENETTGLVFPMLNKSSVALTGMVTQIKHVITMRSDNKGIKDICVNCIIDAFERADKRPKAAPENICTRCVDNE